MRFARMEIDGEVRAVVSVEDKWCVTSAEDVAELIRSPELIAAALSGGRRVSARKVLRPIQRPGKILCCGLNYRDHIRETGRDTPRYPTLFAKFSDTLTDPGADIIIHGAELVDWEAELVVVVGAEVLRADPEQARRAIFGYTAANDLSMRDWQSRTSQWLQGKAFDGTTAIGPVIAGADEFDPQQPHRISAEVEGALMQESTTSQMLFESAELVSYISQFTRLSPGDLILSGTPGGVGLGLRPPRFLRDGEQVRIHIEGIGEVVNRIKIPSAGKR